MKMEGKYFALSKGTQVAIYPLREFNSLHTCPYQTCHKVYPSVEGVKYHVHKEHPILTPYRCHERGCTSSFRDLVALQNHKEIHLQYIRLALKNTRK